MHFLSNRRLIFALFVLVWFECSVPSFFQFRTIKPDFFLIFIAFYAFKVERKNVVVIAFILGLIKDLFANSFFGLETISYSLGAMFVKFLSDRLDRDKYVVAVPSLFTFSLVSLACYAAFAFASGVGQVFDLGVLWRIFYVSLYTTVFGLAALPVLEKWVKPGLGSKQYELF